jgi:hypothetical protein
MLSPSRVRYYATLLSLSPHELHGLGSPLVQLLVGLPGVLPVPLTHLAEVLILHVECFQFFFHDFHLLLIVAVHL